MKSNKAFTIIELLIVFVIIIIFPIIVISSFSRIKAQFALSRAAYQFAQNLRQAQVMALSSEPYKEASGFTRKINGYGIYLDSDRLGPTRYLLYADSVYSAIGNNEYDVLDYPVASYDINIDNPGVVIKEIKHVTKKNTSVHFMLSSADVVMSSLEKDVATLEIVFGLSENTAITKSVLVNTSGLIEVK